MERENREKWKLYRKMPNMMADSPILIIIIININGMKLYQKERECQMDDTRSCQSNKES